jgi:hypothetical protein
LIAFSATVKGSVRTPTSWALGQRNDVLRILHVVLGQITVALVDPALGVDVVGRHVLEPDLVVDAVARAADGCDHERAGFDRARDVGTDLDDAAEAFVWQ